MPFDRIAKVSTPAMVAMDSRLQNLDQISVSPIIGVHVYLGCDPQSPPMKHPHMVFMKSPLQWVFNKGVEPVETPGGPAHAQHLHGVISAAHDLVDKPAQQIIDMVVGEIRRMIPAATFTPVLHAKAVKEKRATFSAAPGFERLRPGASGAIANLFLAGDWTRTGWPATMEGAVRSGYLAAAAIDPRCADETHANAGVVPDLEPSPIYRFIAG
jgi:zeta-carotene desaturase